MEVVISIPVSYLDPWTLGRTDIIDFNNIYIMVFYLLFEFFFNNYFNSIIKIINFIKIKF